MSPQWHTRRAALLGGLAAVATFFVFPCSRAGKSQNPRLKIAASSAPEALAEFVRQTGLQVLFDFDAIRQYTTHEIDGELAPEEALRLMLDGSGLMYEFVNERTVSIRPLPSRP